MPYMAVYAASKVFIVSFTEALIGGVSSARNPGGGAVPWPGGDVLPQCFRERDARDWRQHVATADGVSGMHAREEGKRFIILGVILGVRNAMAVQSTRFMPRSFLAQATARALRPKRLSGPAV
jgi:short-subunit dehydrogenase